MQGLAKRLLTVLVIFIFFCQSTGFDPLTFQVQINTDTLRPNAVRSPGYSTLSNLLTALKKQSSAGIINYLNTKKTVNDLSPEVFEDKVVLLRGDINIGNTKNLKAEKLTKLRALLPDIRFLLERGVKLVVIASHNGRAKDFKKDRKDGEVDDNYSLKPIAPILEAELGERVSFASSCVGEEAEKAVEQAISDGVRVLFLEDTRFWEGETIKGAKLDIFARRLARAVKPGIYVNSASATFHRHHGSVGPVAEYIDGPKVLGLQAEKELSQLYDIFDNPEKSVVLIMGGVKPDKLEIMESLLTNSGVLKHIVVIGPLALAFAKGEVKAKKIMELAAKKGVGLSWPEECVVVEIPANYEREPERFVDDLRKGEIDIEKLGLEVKTVKIGSIPTRYMMMDASPDSMEVTLKEALSGDASLVVLNGTAGMYEHKRFADGHNALIVNILGFTTKEKRKERPIKKTKLIGGDATTATVTFLGREKAEKEFDIVTMGGAALLLFGGNEFPIMRYIDDKVIAKASSAGNVTYALSVSGIDKAINRYKDTPAVFIQLESLRVKLNLVVKAVVASADTEFAGLVEDFHIIEYEKGGVLSWTIEHGEEFFRAILMREGYSYADIVNTLNLIELYGSYSTEELAIENIGETLTYLSIYSEIISEISEIFPGAIISPATSTRYKDTRINGDDVNRAAALDIHENNGTYLEVAAPQKKDADRLHYQYLVLSIAVPSGHMPSELQRELEDAETEKDVKKIIVEYLKENFDSPNIPIEPEQSRSHNLKDTDTANIARADFESAIAAYDSKDGTLLAQVHFWIKDNPLALELINKRIKSSMKKPNVEIPKNWNINALLNISDSEKALDTLAQNAWIFFKEFSEGNFTTANLLATIINRINPSVLINPEGISIDTDLGIFVSQKDAIADIPNFGEHLKEFLASLNIVRQLTELLYLLSTPQFDENARKGICIDSNKLKEALLRFYYRLYAHIDEVSTKHFNDITVFEPLRIGLATFTSAFNKAVRYNDAIELNGEKADVIIAHLLSKGIDLTETEIKNIKAVYNLYKHRGGIWAHDIFQMRELLTESHFIDAFYHLKVDAPKDILPSERSNLIIDASGRISRMALALRFCSDMNAREPEYIGRYAIRTREIDYENRLNGAKAIVERMFSDSVIETAGLYMPTGKDGYLVLLSELIKSGRLKFDARSSIISAKQDFVQREPIECVCPVDVSLDGRHIATIYIIESEIFKSGLKDTVRIPDNINIPRPFIIQEEDGIDIYFGMMIDATPGGVYIGDGKIESHDAIGNKPTVWSLAATKGLESASRKTIDARKELVRLGEILSQVEKERFLPGDKRFFCYVKAQITKKLLLPLGGGIHTLGRFIHKLPKIKDTGAIFLTPTSCSTNGASYFAQAASTLFGFGSKRLVLIGTTAHMYTSGKDAQPYNPFGHFSAQGTGAAEGVKQHFDIMALFTSLRTPTSLKDGKTDVVGGSVFDFLLRLPFPAQKEVFISFLRRIEQEFPKRIVTFSEEDKIDGRYTWKKTNSGQKTGSIVYVSSIKQLTGRLLNTKVAYDNEMSFSVKMNQGLKAISLARIRQIDRIKRAEVITKASSAGIQEPRGFDYDGTLGQHIGVPNQSFRWAMNTLSSKQLDIDGLNDVTRWLKKTMPKYERIIEENVEGSKKDAEFNLQYAQDTVKAIEGILLGARLQEYEGLREEFTSNAILKEHRKLIPWFLDMNTALGKQIITAQRIGELKEIEERIGCKAILFTPGDDIPALLIRNGFSANTAAIGISTPEMEEYFKKSNIKLIALDNLSEGQYLPLSLLATYSKAMLYVSTIDDPKIHGKLMNLAVQMHNSITSSKAGSILINNYLDTGIIVLELPKPMVVYKPGELENLQKQEVATMRAA